MKISKLDQINSALLRAKLNFKYAEKKDWDENNGYAQCTNKMGFYYHGQAHVLQEILEDGFKHYAKIDKLTERQI